MIRLSNVEKYFNRGKSNEIHVINNVSLELPERGMVALFGRSGCGKTTLLNAIGGLDTVASGSITVNGRDMREDPDDIRNRNIGYILQNYCLNRTVTVGENVAASLYLCGMPRGEEAERRVRTALHSVGMEKYYYRMPDTLSGGQQQRVAIARALVKNPPVILADEPTGNLDEANTVLIMDILKEISREHLVLLVTHEENLVRHYCDRIISLSDGRILSDSENRDANGYAAKDKNTVYLADLPCERTELSHISLSYYGEEPAQQIRLRIVNVSGKLYIESSDPAVRMLDAQSEMRLDEGHYHPDTTVRKRQEAFHMEDLPPVAPGGKTGRLFRFPDAVRSGFRAHFTGRKKSTKALIAVMICFSLVLVTIISFWGTNILKFRNMESSYAHEVLFVPLTDSGTGADTYRNLMTLTGSDGITAAFPLSFLSTADATFTGMVNLTFRIGSFENANLTLRTQGMYRPADGLHGKTLLAGTTEITAHNQVVITQGVADKLLSSATIQGLTYDSLLHLRASSNPYGNYYQEPDTEIGGSVASPAPLEIVGIVKESSPYLYVTPLRYTYHALSNRNTYEILPYSLLPGAVAFDEPQQGAVLYNLSYVYTRHGTTPRPGSLMIAGESFAIGQALYRTSGTFSDFLAEKGISLQLTQAEKRTFLAEALPAYLNKETAQITEADLNTYLPLADLLYRLSLLKYYMEYVYAGSEILTAEQYAGYSGSEFAYNWLLATSYGRQELAFCPDTTDVTGALILLYLAQNNTLPALNGFLDENGEKLSDDTSWIAFSADDTMVQLACRDYLPAEIPGYADYCAGIGIENGDLVLNDLPSVTAVLSDADYLRLLSCTGKSTETVTSREDTLAGVALFFSDEHAAQAAVKAVVPAGTELLLPDAVRSQVRSELALNLLAQTIPTLVITVLLGLCMFFIMRTGFLGRIKEIGVYRAIGVRRSNLNFRFFVESLVLFALTVLPGFLLTSVFMLRISAQGGFSSEFIYYPPWMALLTLAYLLLIALISGLLPITGILRKTPSQILAQYDI